jgi:hypothetical protein
MRSRAVMKSSDIRGHDAYLASVAFRSRTYLEVTQDNDRGATRAPQPRRSARVEFKQ